jgi:hypothetical protein
MRSIYVVSAPFLIPTTPPPTAIAAKKKWVVDIEI